MQILRSVRREINNVDLKSSLYYCQAVSEKKNMALYPNQTQAIPRISHLSEASESRSKSCLKCVHFLFILFSLRILSGGYPLFGRKYETIS
jgi:hypothetical protein